MDLTGYDAFLDGKLDRYELPDKELEKTEACLKELPKAEVRKSGKW